MLKTNSSTKIENVFGDFIDDKVVFSLIKQNPNKKDFTSRKKGVVKK
jgi:hypothetical protein